MKQSRAMSLVESLSNIAVGFGLSVGAQALVLPMLGVPIPLTANLIFAVVMTVISIARSFGLRRLFEAMHVRHPLSPGAFAVIAERRRQIDQEGWSRAHDDDLGIGELAMAGATYAEHAAIGVQLSSIQRAFDHDDLPPASWPWDRNWWKPQDFRRDMVRAAALILAEIDRHDRNRRPRVLTRITLPRRQRSAA